MIRCLLFTSILLTYHAGIAQTPHLKGSTAPMEPMSFMLGKWEGQSWTMGPQGKSYATTTEHARCKWECELILVEGKGTVYDSASQRSNIVHNAFGVIRYEAHRQAFIMQAYSQGRGMIESEIRLLEEKMFQWGMDIPNGGKMRYTADFREEGKWKEWGEYSHDGENWRKILDMDLTKVSD
ncbi:MAG: hypothetical protein AAF587_29415 [Bacteroidota bacterium]